MSAAMRACALLMTLLLAACYNGPGTDSKMTAAPAAISPAAVGFTGLPNGVVRAPYSYSGIYDDSALDEPCCWLDRRAKFQTVVPKGATRLVFTVRIPDLPVFRRTAQSVQISLNSHKPVVFPKLGVGIHALSLPIAKASSSGVASVDMSMGFTFVPKEQHLNLDTRSLSLYLIRVRAL